MLASILVIFPSKQLLVLKTSWRQLQDKFWRSLQYFFGVSIFWLPRHLTNTSGERLDDVLKTFRKTTWRHLQDILEDKNSYAEVVFKTAGRHVLKIAGRYVLKMAGRHVLKMAGRHVLRVSWRHVLRKSWRHLRDKRNVLLGISVFNHSLLTNLNQYVTNLYFTNLYFRNLRRSQNVLIRT